MDVNQNFERLEQEVIRLMEVLEKLRDENVELKERVQSLETNIGIVGAENERLKQIESAHAESNRGKEEIKGRIENILGRLDGLDL
ncbi:MAG: cell division protein ZapB [Candidatus Latescibacterota bacterium]|nr:cell division protein ZapB [Candidatus Latescibacterota bacterium]|tara:strand:- start:86 stop:343 length:258 start_codon:yes stop_codon:yes gene_type:complete